MGQKNTVASLEIELLMATASAVSDLVRFGGQVDKTTAESIKNLDRIDAAMKGIGDMSGPTAKMVQFAEETARTAVSAAREFNRIEKAGEALSAQLDRQISVYGKTTVEIRAMKVEAAAAAAESQNQIELATRLRRQGAELASMEAAATAEAAATREREAQATREAALAYNMFEAAARKGMEIHREQQAAEAAAAMEREAQAVRSAALAHAMFEARAREGARVMREQEAAADADAAAVTRLRDMLDPAAAAQAQLNHELAEARRVMTAAGVSGTELARVEQMITDRHRQAAVSSGAMRQAMAGASYQVQDLVTQISMGANPITAFVVQGGQLAGQFQSVGGKAGAVASFLMGPWGLAIQIGLMAFAPFIGKLLEGSDAAEKQKQALDEQRKAVLALAEAEGDALKTAERQQAERAASIQQKLNDALATRQQTQATLELARANLLSAKQRAEDPMQNGEFNAGAAAAAGFESQVAALDKTLAANVRETKRLQEGFEASFARLITQAAEAASTPEGAIRARYGRQLMEAQQDPTLLGIGNEAKLRAKVDGIIAERDREIKAIQESTKVRRDADTLTAASVAKMLRGEMPGVQITNTTRSFADNKRVGGSANSHHLRGNAIDFVPAGGMDSMTKADVRRIFEARGIEVVELLGPGDKNHNDHFHVAWTKGKLSLDAFTDAAKRAKKEADLLTDLRLFTDGDAISRSLASVAEARKRQSDEFNRDARDLLRIEGDPLAAILEQGKAEQRDGVTAWMDNYKDSLDYAADRWDLIARNVQSAAGGMADAFGSVGQAIGDMAVTYASFEADRARLGDQHRERVTKVGITEAQINRENARYALATATSQIALYGDMASAAKGFFKEGTSGYKALETAEKTFRAIEFALSVRAMAQDAINTAQSVVNSGARAAADAAAAVAKAIASLPFPLNIAAGAATAAVLASIGIAIGGAFGGGGAKPDKANDGTGTIFGDAAAKSESIKRAIDQLREVDTTTSVYAREMAGSLRSIENQIGGFAYVLVRAGNVNASDGVATGFKPNLVGSVLGAIPLIGGFLSSLFGSKTEVVGGGLYGGPQSLGSILDGGFNAQTYSDVKKTSKFLGIKTGTSYSTKYGAADPELAGQFTLILRSFSDAITAAAGPLGESTDAIAQRLQSMVISIGKVDLQGLTGAEIEEKLSAIFGAAADNMASGAFPSIMQFQKAGEGAFETLVRVASTVEAVTTALDQLGGSSQTLSIAAKLGLADQFDTLGDLTSAVSGYFDAFFTREEQAAARQAQLTKVFDSLNIAMPGTLGAFRQLVEAQDLTTSAGQATYATLLQLAPAFAELQHALAGAKTAADVAAERADLERKLLELRGDTAALRALDLAKLDASNRGLQKQVWAVEDAQKAAAAADELRKAWSSVGDSIMDEVKRIRGLTGTDGASGFAVLMGQFNAATSAARGGDQDAAKSLPGLSQALLKAAADAATSRQELDRIQAETAASLEATYGAIRSLGTVDLPAAADPVSAASTAAQASGSATTSNDSIATELRTLREENAGMRRDLTSALASIAANTGRTAKHLDNVTADSGGDAISTRAA